MAILRLKASAGKFVVTRVGTQDGDFDPDDDGIVYAMTSMVHASPEDAIAVAQLGVPRKGPDGKMLTINKQDFVLTIHIPDLAFPHLDTGTRVPCHICKLEAKTT